MGMEEPVLPPNFEQPSAQNYEINQLIIHTKKFAENWMQLARLKPEKKVSVLLAFEHDLQRYTQDPDFPTTVPELERYAKKRLIRIVNNHPLQPENDEQAA